jgi:hypothetical protein
MPAASRLIQPSPDRIALLAQPRIPPRSGSTIGGGAAVDQEARRYYHFRRLDPYILGVRN